MQLTYAEREDISNIVLMLSSDDEDIENRPKQTRKPTVNGTPQNKTYSANIKTTASDIPNRNTHSANMRATVRSTTVAKKD